MDNSLLITFAFIIMILIISAIKQYSIKRIEFKEKIAHLEKGLPMPFKNDECSNKFETHKELTATCSKQKSVIWISISLGIAIAFALISLIVGDKDVLVVCALAVIPLLIGIGYFINSIILSKQK